MSKKQRSLEAILKELSTQPLRGDRKRRSRVELLAIRIWKRALDGDRDSQKMLLERLPASSLPEPPADLVERWKAADPMRNREVPPGYHLEERGDGLNTIDTINDDPFTAATEILEALLKAGLLDEDLRRIVESGKVKVPCPVCAKLTTGFVNIADENLTQTPQ